MIDQIISQTRGTAVWWAGQDSWIVIAKPRVPFEIKGIAAVTEENRFWSKGYPDEVKLRLSQSLKERYHILKPGDGMEIK